jgi:hypothetical protein
MGLPKKQQAVMVTQSDDRIELASVLGNVRLPSQIRPIRRIFKHPHLMPYNRLATLMVAANLILFWWGLAHAEWWSSHGVELKMIATIAQVNFALAIVLRQQYVVNLLFWLATLAPTTWPLRIRWALAKVYHLGGLHVGAAAAGTLWYAVFVGSLTCCATQNMNNVSVGNVVVSYILVGLFSTMIIAALPLLRARAHDSFEVTHRFCGWAVLMLIWVNTTWFAVSQRGQASIASAVLTAPSVWLLVATTLSTALPWMRLRKVSITVDQPSSHVVIVRVDHGVTPMTGSARPISRRPLLGWHAFASVSAPRHSPGGYRLIVSRAGDWTTEFIGDPPSHVWVRGIPTAGMANVKKLFTKVVYIATGSGIGPMLAHLLANEVPAHLVWVTRSPRETYGDELVDELLGAQPDMTIWNSDEQGRPDMVRLAYAAVVFSGAEAVICIANKKVTWQVVHGLESRGIPACGPIWDS